MSSAIVDDRKKGTTRCSKYHYVDAGGRVTCGAFATRGELQTTNRWVAVTCNRCLERRTPHELDGVGVFRSRSTRYAPDRWFKP